MYNAIKVIFGSLRLFLHWLQLQAGASISNSSQRRSQLMLFGWGFPPTTGGGVFRPTSIAKYASRAGWKVSVIASPLDEPAGSAGIELLKTIPSDVAVIRAPKPLTASYRLLPRIDGGFANLIAAAQAALVAGKTMRPSIILASGPPFMIFVAAYLVARKLGVPLVLDYRDEWTVHTPRWIRTTAFDRKWERKLLKHASAVVFVTDAVRTDYLASIPELLASKCFLVPNGWDPEDFDVAGTTPTRASETPKDGLTIAFVGSTVGYSDPRPFLEIISKAAATCPELRDRLKLRFVGRKVDDFRRHLEDARTDLAIKMEIVDEVPKADAIAEMQTADALLILLDPYYSQSIPGKLYEYLAAGPPILVYGNSGIVADIVTDLKAGFAVPHDDSVALIHALTAMLNQPRTNWDTGERRAWLARHTRGALASDILRILQQAEMTSAAK